jgi:hypothetical protein
MNIAAVFYRKGVTYPQAFRGTKKILHLVMYAPKSSATVYSHPKLIGVGKRRSTMKATEPPAALVSPCVRIFIESLIKELAGTRCDQTFTLSALEEELAVGGISGGAAEDDP